MPYKSNIQIMFSVSETHIQPSPEIYCIILCMRDVLTPDDPDLTVIAADCGTWRVYQAHLTHSRQAVLSSLYEVENRRCLTWSLE